MSQQVVEHSAIAGGGDKVARYVAEMFKEGFKELQIDIAKNLTLRAIETVLDPSQFQGQPHFVLPGGRIGIPIPLPVASDASGQFSAGEARDLADKLRVVQIPENDPNFGLAETTAALDAINSQEDSKEILAEALEDKRKQDPVVSRHDMELGAVPRLIACGWAEAIDLTFIRRFLSRATKSFIRRCLNPTQDGKRVSREVHEYNYCRNSGQIEEIIGLIFAYDQSSGSGQLAGGQGPSVEEFSYGNFVDLVQLRKAIAKIRKVDRLLRSANFLEFARLTGTTISTLRDQLITEVDLSEAVQEWDDKFPIAP